MAGRSRAIRGCVAPSSGPPGLITTSNCWPHKPGALEHSLALRQEREQGRWPECFDALWRAIEVKVGASEAARQMVDVLLLCREHGLEVVELAVRGVLARGRGGGEVRGDARAGNQRHPLPRFQPHAAALLAGAHAERGRQHRLPRAALADQNHLFAVVDPGAFRQRRDRRLRHLRVVVEAELLQVFDERETGVEQSSAFSALGELLHLGFQ